MFNKEVQEKEFQLLVNEIAKRKPMAFCGIANLMGIPIWEYDDANMPIKGRDSIAIYDDIVAKFKTMNRFTRRGVLKTLRNTVDSLNHTI